MFCYLICLYFRLRKVMHVQLSVEVQIVGTAAGAHMIKSNHAADHNMHVGGNSACLLPTRHSITLTVQVTTEKDVNFEGAEAEDDLDLDAMAMVSFECLLYCICVMCYVCFCVCVCVCACASQT